MVSVLYTFVLLSSYRLLIIGAVSTGHKHLLIQGQSVTGQSEVYGKDVDGKSVKIVRFPQSKIAAVTMVSDQDRLVKLEYDHNGRLIDCDTIDNQADVSRFIAHVDENVDKAMMNKERMLMAEHGGHHVFDIEAQMKQCKEWKQTDQDVTGKRYKRSYLIWPGTNWCGKGSKAEFADSIGPNKETDQCCKKHDQCPYIIDGFTTRYNLFNYRVHTLSHCDCDIPFMGCLKSANTTTAAMVGKVYFNVVNTECFELNLQKTCARRSWWGGCEKYTTKWTAAIKSLGNFPE